MLFLLIPQPWFKIIVAKLSDNGDATTIKSLITERLMETSTALQDVSTTTRDVAIRLGKISSGDINGVYDKVGDTVCKKCPYAMKCWNEDYTQTVDVMANSIRQLMQGQTLDEDSFPASFSHCVRRSAVGAFLTEEYRRFVKRDEGKRLASRTRRLFTDQLEGMSMVIDDIVQQVGDIYANDSLLASKADELLRSYHLEPQRAICWKNKEGQLSILVEIPQYKEPRSTPELLAKELSELCQLTISYPVITRKNNLTRMIFREQPRFAIEYGSFQINCGNHAVCGDSFRILNNHNNMAHLLLSDGMGSGNSAAVDSAMAASLIARMLESGISYPSAIKMMNGALLVKSSEESLATIDAAMIDLYTGKVKFYKAGAAPTVVRKEGRGIEIESTSLPAGILEGVEFQQSQITLDEGDLILLMSDGAVPDGSKWIAKIVENYAEQDLDNLCKKIAKTAKLRRTDGKDDDITVICCRLTLKEQRCKEYSTN